MTTAASSSTSSRPARRKCYRCESPSTLLLRKTVASCTPCALKAVEARTRPLLELARGAALLDTNGFLDGMHERGTGSLNGAGSSDRPRGAVALAFSGGPSSRALLDIAVRSLSPPPVPIDADPSSSSSQQNGKRRPVDVTRLHVIYIDDSALHGSSASDQTDEVRAIVESYGGATAGLKFVPVKLEEIFEDEDGDEAVEQLVLATQEEAAAAGRPSSRIRAQKRPHTTSSSARNSLLTLFNTLSPTTTAARSTLPAVRTRFETLHHSLLQHLLRRTARHKLGCSSLLLGESATRSSVRMLSSLAVGAGHKWTVEGAEGGVWVDDLLVLRPMKETLDKEVAFYVKYKELPCVETRNLVSPPAGGPASIGRLTQSFIAALEKGVPSTVSTVGRTGSKLVLKEAGSMSSLGESLLPGRGSFDDLVRGKSGVGQKGDRLMATVLKDTQRWTWRRTNAASTSSTENGQPTPPRPVVLPCPLCGLPAQEGAGRWRQKITIRQQDAGEEVDDNRQAASSSSSSVNLDEMLCYPCLSLFLDAAQAQAQAQPVSTSGDGLLLPTHVLRLVEQRRRYAQAGLGQEHDRPHAAPSVNGEAAAAGTAEEAATAADDDLDASADGGRRRAAAAAAAAAPTTASANGKEDAGIGEATAAGDAESVAILRRHATRRLDKQDMQGKIGGYLLDEEEESAPQ